jgi:hypothetical protein
VLQYDVLTKESNMITLREFFELIDYRINEGSDHGWQCYGDYAHIIDHADGDYTTSVIFDRQCQTVYEITVCDYKNNRAYRMIHPDYQAAHKTESIKRSVNPCQAWDDVEYVDLETVEDFVIKTQAIIDGQDYDTRVSIPIDLPESEMLKLFMMAHQRDMTFNEYVTEMLEQQLGIIKKELEVHGADHVRKKYKSAGHNVTI